MFFEIRKLNMEAKIQKNNKNNIGSQYIRPKTIKHEIEPRFPRLKFYDYFD